MKKFVLPFFSLLLVLSLALSSFSSVTAAGGGDPWVTPVSGDMEFTATVVPIASLPGVIELASQMLAPAGFPAGEAQFGGNGVRVTDFDAGKATACFSLSALEVSQGWGGKVAMWNGTTWVPLSTTIAPVALEASSTSACAGIIGNGTYAFIKYIADAALLPPKGLPACGVMSAALPLGINFDNNDALIQYGFVIHDSLIPNGTRIGYQLLNVVPSGFITSGQSGSGIVMGSIQIDDVYLAMVESNPIVRFEYDSNKNLESLTLRVILPQCYTDFQYPNDLDSIFLWLDWLNGLDGLDGLDWLDWLPGAG